MEKKKDLPYGINRVLISKEQIRERVKELARSIDEDYKDSKEPLIVIGVLKGSFIFLSDLVRELTIPHVVDFIAISSYGAETRSSGHVRLIMDTREELKGRDVLIVEDILDSGHTLDYLNRSFLSREPKSVKNVVLLDKPERHEVNIKIAYQAFVIPDVWVVGYGMDYKEQFRTLGYIAEFDPTKLGN